jgi:hypothetical protein
MLFVNVCECQGVRWIAWVSPHMVSAVTRRNRDYARAASMNGREQPVDARRASFAHFNTSDVALGCCG